MSENHIRLNYELNDVPSPVCITIFTVCFQTSRYRGVPVAEKCPVSLCTRADWLSEPWTPAHGMAPCRTQHTTRLTSRQVSFKAWTSEQLTISLPCKHFEHFITEILNESALLRWCSHCSMCWGIIEAGQELRPSRRSHRVPCSGFVPRLSSGNVRRYLRRDRQSFGSVALVSTTVQSFFSGLQVLPHLLGVVLLACGVGAEDVLPYLEES